jgi:hypothetical protein
MKLICFKIIVHYICMFTLREHIKKMNTIMKEMDILHIALENLFTATKIKGKWIKPKNLDEDGDIEFTIEGEIRRFYIEIKKELRQHHLPNILQIANIRKPLIVVARNIFPKLKEELRQNNIGYLEANGNIYLNENKVYVWIEGNKLIDIDKEIQNRAFTKTGLKVVFHFLRDEQNINMPYREIVRNADVALGNINYIIKGLIESGFLIRLNNERYKLTKKKELLEKWLTGYTERLKPTLEIGTFRFLKQEDFINWKKLPLKNTLTYWGGEPAGALLTNYLQPEILTLYTIEPRTELMKNYRLIPDTTGNVKVFKKFWNYDDANNNTAPPLLIYTDLINFGDERCTETANMIYDEFLKGKYE